MDEPDYLDEPGMGYRSVWEEAKRALVVALLRGETTLEDAKQQLGIEEEENR